jgi:hypothetical protein
LLNYNGDDSGIKISVLYWRCSLIRVSVIRGSSFISGSSEFNRLYFTVLAPKSFSQRCDFSRLRSSGSVHACAIDGYGGLC